jgi:hypothetical protein
MNALDAYSETYAEAREQFLAAAQRCDLDVCSHIHPLLGSAGETLALDEVLDGPRHAARLLVISSGCHGIEGHVGSAVQTALLNDPAWRQSTHDAGVAVLYLHALNPHGFSWGRRTTQENVDLNRNFHDFTQPLPRNPDYAEMAALLVPPHWPPGAQVEAALGQRLARLGLGAMQHAVSCGQYEYPEGLFYGGVNPTWSHVTLRQVMREHGRDCARLGWIDLHSGLGPCGVGERIYEGRPGDERSGLRRARAWWGREHRRWRVGLGQRDRPDAARAVRRMPRGRMHRHHARIRHRAVDGRAGRAACRAVAGKPSGNRGADQPRHPAAVSLGVLPRRRRVEAAGAGTGPRCRAAGAGRAAAAVTG